MGGLKYSQNEILNNTYIIQTMFILHRSLLGHECTQSIDIQMPLLQLKNYIPPGLQNT
jgi:hypothetical protein